MPGIGNSTKSGSAFVSKIPITGIFNFFASRIANLSFNASKTKTISGIPPRFLMPPRFKFNLSFSLLIFKSSFLERLRLVFLSERSISSSSSFFIEIEIVFQLVKVPPSHLLLI